ncbi:MAG TPA: glycosyltransferase family 9 protein [Gemmatimonadaceae bacterium]
MIRPTAVQTRDKFLIIRLVGVGDVVMASSVARRLREERPAAHIAWLCGNTAAPLVERFSCVDEVIAVDERRLMRGSAVARLAVLIPLWRQLIKARFTHIVLLHPDPRYRVLVAPLRGAQLFAQTRDARLGSINPIPGRYLGDEFARVVDGIANRGPLAGHYPLAELAPRQKARELGMTRVALVPGGTRNVLRESVLKRWPVEQYADVAKSLAADGCEVVLVGDAADRWVLDHFKGVRITDRLGALSLPATAELLADCDLVISHDTGPMHLARLARAPLLALFGPTPPSQFVVEDEHTVVLHGGAHLACRPCYDGREFADCSDNQCMSSISADVVFRTAKTMLQRTGRSVSKDAEIVPAARVSSATSNVNDVINGP